MSNPNILIFMTDHQRGDTVLPEHPAITPNVDKLAREGVTFAETFCTAPHCSPARASFHSGLYPSGHGVWNNVCNEQALSQFNTEIATVRGDQPAGTEVTSDSLKLRNEHLSTLTLIQC